MAGVLVERDQQREQIEAAAARTLSDGGTFVAVSGDAGTGKTSLLEVGSAAIARLGFEVIELRCESAQTIQPFHLLKQLVEGKRDLPEGRAQLLAALLTEERLSDEQSAEGLYWTLSGFASERPLAVIVDDVQWIDERSAEALTEVAARLHELPVLLLVATRERIEETSAASRDLVEHADVRLELTELSKAGVEALVHQHFREAPSGFVSAAYERTHGNPFLLSSLLGEMKRASLPLDDEGIDRAAPLGAADLAQEWLKRLSPAARSLALVVADVGSGTELAIIAGAAGLDLDSAVDAGDELVAAGVFSDAADLTFAHDLIRTSLLRSQSEAVREERVLRAARVADERGADPIFVADLVARLSAEPNEWIRNKLVAGARAALEEGSPGTAARFAGVVVERGELDPEVLLLLGEALTASDTAAAVQHLEAALEVQPAGELQVKILDQLGNAFTLTARYPEAHDAYSRGADLAATIDPDIARGLRAKMLSAAWMSGRAGEETVAEMETIAARADGTLTPAETTLLVTGAAAMSFFGAREREASVALVLKAWDGGKLLDLLPPGDVTPYLITGVCLVAEEHQRNLEINDVLIERARSQGSLMAYANACYVRACPLYDLARIDETISFAQAAVDARSRGWEQYAFIAKGYLALGLIERGDLDAAEQALDYHADEAEGRGDVMGILMGKAKLLLESGEYAAAGRVADEAHRMMMSIGYVNPDMLPVFPTHFEALRLAGRTDEARALVAEFATRVESWGTARARARLLRAQAALTDTDRVAMLEEGCRIAREGESVLDRMWLEKELADAYLAVGANDQARDLLVRVADEAQRRNCRLLAHRAMHSLDAAGGRPRTIEPAGLDTLSPLEMLVANLVAEGHATGEVAEALFLPVKTVRSHLTNIFRKLRIESAAQLAKIVREDQAR
jgi:DNA-binding CsgD family transcriptional regulator